MIPIIHSLVLKWVIILVTFKRCFSRITAIRKDIRNMKRIGELIEYIPIKNIEATSYYLLLLWILSPIYVVAYSLICFSHEEAEFVLNQALLRIQWNTLLQQIGFIGLFTALIMCGKSYLISNNNRESFRAYIGSHKLQLLLFLMLMWSILSFCLSDNRPQSFYGSYYRRDGLLSYFAYAGIFSCGYIIRKAKHRKMLLEAFTYTALLLSCLMLADSPYINNLLTLFPNSSVFCNINHFGYYLCLAIMCSVTLIMLEQRNILLLLLRYSSLAVLTAALIVNSSFGPYMAVVMGFVLLLTMVFLYYPCHKIRLIIAFSLFILVTATINLNNEFLSKEIFKLSGGISDIVADNETAGEAGSGRWELWVNGVRFITEKPLFGYGPDNLGVRYERAGIDQDRPHNEIIQFAASLGIPAALLYISALLVYFMRLYNNRKKLRAVEIGLLSAVFAYLMSSMLGNTMYYTTPYFFMVLGLSAGMFNRCPDSGCEG